MLPPTIELPKDRPSRTVARSSSRRTLCDATNFSLRFPAQMILIPSLIASGMYLSVVRGSGPRSIATIVPASCMTSNCAASLISEPRFAECKREQSTR